MNFSPNQFLDELPEIYNSETPWSFRGRNFQAFELGLDNENNKKGLLYFCYIILLYIFAISRLFGKINQEIG